MKNTGEHIFVVEDDPDISDLISRQALQPLGYQVTVVKDGSTALRQAVQTPPDLLIANLNIPGLHAKDLLVALASQGVNAPLVVIAEKGQEEDILQAFRLGASDYLHWPANDAEVVSVVERILQMTREGRARIRLERQLKDVNKELQRKVNELTGIIAIGKAVVSITDQHRLFTKIVEEAMQAVEAELSWLLLREEASKAFLLTAHCNLPRSWAKKLNQPLEDGISPLVSLSGETLLIHGKPLERFRISALGKSAAVVPIKARSVVIGLLLVVRKKERPFSRTEQILLEAVADYASISLVNARLFRALEKAAESAKSGERQQNALLESFRKTVRNELLTANHAIELLLSQKPGLVAKQQRDELQTAQAALHSLARAAEKTIPSVLPLQKRRS